ncbi:hypothetical protein [Acrocarpospora sp. B8E8]|uniref:hypothetical protein n=1 Tax=Acrocarpospora sp. B8E8 TaxID=3153572 RepID=UPI00325F6208
MARKVVFEALIHGVTVTVDDMVKPIFKPPLVGNVEGLVRNARADDAHEGSTDAQASVEPCAGSDDGAGCRPASRM